MKISAREMKLMIITVFTISGFFIWSFIDKKKPIYDNQKNQIESINNNILINKHLIENKDTWEEELNKLQESLTIYTVKEKSIATKLMQNIKKISSESGIDIPKIQPFEEKTKTIGNLFEIGINCQWQADLESLIIFLTKLQQSGIKYDIRSLNITPSGKGFDMIKGSMVIHCAYLKE